MNLIIQMKDFIILNLDTEYMVQQKLFLMEKIRQKRKDRPTNIEFVRIRLSFIGMPVDFIIGILQEEDKKMHYNTGSRLFLGVIWIICTKLYILSINTGMQKRLY